jgi:hypothetical protein
MLDVEFGKIRSADALDIDAKRKANPKMQEPGLVIKTSQFKDLKLIRLNSQESVALSTIRSNT